MLLPRRHGEHTNYPTRRENSFIPFKANSEKYRRSLIPESVRTWNNLNNYTRASTSLGQFKTSMRMQLFCKKIPFHSNLRGKSAVNHTRICLGLSPLRQHLHSYHYDKYITWLRKLWGRIWDTTPLPPQMSAVCDQKRTFTEASGDCWQTGHWN